jgi:predicted RNase H-like HicB family nuclease
MLKYTMKVFWSEEDESFIAIIPNIPEFEYISAFGDTPEEAVRELRICLKGVISSLEEDGKPIPKPPYEKVV